MDAPHKRETARSFDAAAEAYLESDVHRQGADLDRLAEWCSGATRALDVATGAGHTAGAVSRAGVPEVVAADAAPAMARSARDNFGALPVLADAERLPFSESSFDAVTCRIAPHHFPHPEAFVGEVARVLESGGVFALEDTVAPAGDLGTFINRVERLRDPTHVESYPTERWVGWLEEAGFTVEATEHGKTELDFEQWTAAQSLEEGTKAEVEALLLEAGDEARELFEIRVEAGEVRTFCNLKLLCRARR